MSCHPELNQYIQDTLHCVKPLLEKVRVPGPPAHLTPNMGWGDAGAMQGLMTSAQKPIPCTPETTPNQAQPPGMWAVFLVLGSPRGPGILSPELVLLVSGGA